ncbi:MAG: hypothetical protein IJB96_12210 [Lachnospira sp.]|nr:hypothetical protein [Lachnospira sp.]
MLKDYIGRDRKYRLKPWVRYVAGAMAAVIAVCSIGVIPKAPQEVEATEEVAQVKNVNWGTLGIIDPEQPDSADDPWKGSFVYYGQYNDAPIKFRVLDASTQEFNAEGDTESFTMLLDSDAILFKSPMEKEKDPNADANDGEPWVWSQCYLKTFLNSEKSSTYDCTKNGFLTNAFSTMEQKAIAGSYKAQMTSDDYLNEYWESYVALTGEKIFLLETVEVMRSSYGYLHIMNNSAGRMKIHRESGQAEYWMQRSWKDGVNMVAFTDKDGGPAVYTSSTIDMGVAPMLNLNLSSILYTTKSNMAKSDSFALTTDASDNDTWNITLHDSNGFNATMKTDTSKAVKAGSNVTVSVTRVPRMSSSERYTQTSAMLVDKAGTAVAYGKIASSATSGDIDILIPAGVPAGQYTLKVFVEKVNSSETANVTDYASNAVDFELTIEGDDISSVAVENVTQPIGGVELDMSATCTTENIVSTTLMWKKEDTEVSGSAEYGKVYTAYATLTAKEGKEFATSVTATVNGNPATSVVLNADGTLTVGYTFAATEKLGAKLEITAPVFDEVFGYVENQEAKPVIMTNVGDEDVVINSVTIDDSSILQLVGDETTVTLTPGQSVELWSIKPVDHPSVGSYKATITAVYNDDKTATADMEYVVSKKEIKLVEAWDIASPTAGQWLDTTGYCVLQGGDGINDTSPWIYWINLETNQEILGERTEAQYNTKYQVVIRTIFNEAYYYVTEELQATVNGNPATSVKKWGEGTLEIRYDFDPTEGERMPMPQVGINYKQEMLQNFVTDGSYTINGTPVTVTSGQVPILEEWFGTTLSIVRKGEGIYDDSEPQKLYIPVRPAAPDVVGADETVYGANDGKIEKTTTQMEYRKVSTVTWIDCTDEEVTNLSPGFYEVRVKATDTSFAGEIAQVEI